MKKVQCKSTLRQHCNAGNFMARPSHQYIGVDNKTLHDTLLLLKESDARSRVLFAKVHNMQVELSGLKASLDKLIALLLENLQHPEHSGEANAVIRQFLFEKRKP